MGGKYTDMYDIFLYKVLLEIFYNKKSKFKRQNRKVKIGQKMEKLFIEQIHTANKHAKGW